MHCFSQLVVLGRFARICVVGDGDDQWGIYETRGEPFPLSAEFFEAAVALAVYTASSGNPIPQSPMEREWKMWYKAKYHC